MVLGGKNDESTYSGKSRAFQAVKAGCEGVRRQLRKGLHTDEKDPYGAVRLARYLKRITELALNDDEIFLASR